MKLPDHLLLPYLEVYTDVPLEQVNELQKRLGNEPMRCKLFLAHAIVRRYHGDSIADQEQEWFLRTFSERQTPEDIPERQLGPGALRAIDLLQRSLGTERSRSELRRLFRQRAVSLNGQLIGAADQMVSIHDGDVLQVGKRTWFRLRVEE
jgi:tyrosyl-tRNA synthetase